MSFSRALILGTMMMSTPILALADSIGRHGPVYPIQEMSIIEWIEQRLRAMEASGENNRIREKGLQKARSHANRPTPVDGLKTTDVPRTFYHDPGITVDHNITDNNGKIIVPAGTYANPLDVVSLKRKYFFFDGDDRRQQQQARKFYESEAGMVKLVLVSGSPIELMKDWKLRVYFDQNGALVKKVGITQIPAILSQEGRLLRVDEVRVN